MFTVHNSRVSILLKNKYSFEDVQKLRQILLDRGSLAFPVLDNGLFSAIVLSESNEYTGYKAVWVRDNIYVAYAHYLLGTVYEQQKAVKTVKSLTKCFYEQREAFELVIDNNAAPEDKMDRLHIRFEIEGQRIKKSAQEWNHAQNDALGYFLWFYCHLINGELFKPDQKEIKLLILFPLYFQATKYWQDEDSGHWEESPKIEASSIGVVVAALKAMRNLLVNKNVFCADLIPYKSKTVTLSLLDELISEGEEELDKILPWESKQLGKERRYDAALLFLIYPLQVVTGEQAIEILEDVIQNPQGKYGISRYQGDSFWCRDFQDLDEKIRTSIASDREKWLSTHGRTLQAGEEAQWCIFDPIISAIYGLQYQETKNKEFLDKQTYYLNRSLGQLTSEEFQLGGFKCPELYYLQDGKYVPNDSTPLLWTQANLMVALELMSKNVQIFR